jgi:hypothetical protein
MNLMSLFPVGTGDRAGNEPDCVRRLRMRAGLTALPNAHALTIANSMILETIHGHHTNLQPHSLRASTRQENTAGQ